MNIVLYGEVFHRLFKVLIAIEVTADKIILSAHGFSLADRRGKEIAILVILAVIE